MDTNDCGKYNKEIILMDAVASESVSSPFSVCIVVLILTLVKIVLYLYYLQSTLDPVDTICRRATIHSNFIQLEIYMGTSEQPASYINAGKKKKV